MKNFTLALCASVLLTASAFAQAPDAGAGAADDAAAGKGGGTGKEIMQACRSEAKGQGLKGKEMRQAIMDCAVKKRPAMAGRLKCRMEAKDKGLKGDEMKSYVKSCAKSAG